MDDINAKLLIVGGGPGGYVAAIRASQLGLDVVLAERQALGGTCLNVGCIPSKALIHAADAYGHAMEQAREAPFGLKVEKPSLDFARTIEWKDGIVGRLTGGVSSLLKRGNVKIVRGHASMLDGKTCRIETDTGPQTVHAEHVVLATGSEAVSLPGIPFGDRVISSTEALALPEIPKRRQGAGPVRWRRFADDRAAGRAAARHRRRPLPDCRWPPAARFRLRPRTARPDDEGLGGGDRRALRHLDAQRLGDR